MKFTIDPSMEELAEHFLVDPAPEELPEAEQRRLSAIDPAPAEEPEEEEEEQPRGAKRTSHQRKKDREAHEAEAATLDDEQKNPNPFGVSPRMEPYWRAFNEVVVNYVKFRNASAVSVQDYERVLSDGSDPINGELRQKPDANDFAADVDLAARRALRGLPAMLRLFTTVILNEEGKHWPDVPVKVKAVIVERVGKEFLRAGLTPKKYARVMRRTLEEKRKLVSSAASVSPFCWPSRVDSAVERAVTKRGRPEERGQFLYDRAKVQKLWRRVLHQAQLDCFSKNRYVRGKAANFLSDDSSDLCLMALGVPDPDAFREQLRAYMQSETVCLSFKGCPTFEINGKEFAQKVKQAEEQRRKKKRKTVELKKAA